MNLLKGDVKGGAFVGVNAHVAKISKGDRANVVLGVRPEDVHVSDKKGADFTGKLYSLEPTGDQTLVTAPEGDQLLVAKAARDFRQALETPISFKFDRSRLYLFDAESGERISL